MLTDVQDLLQDFEDLLMSHLKEQPDLIHIVLGIRHQTRVVLIHCQHVIQHLQSAVHLDLCFQTLKFLGILD